jgi:hypothetical protein
MTTIKTYITENKKVSELIEYKFNNKVHSDSQVDLLCNAIIEFGFTTPIVIDENNIIVAGHARLLAAKKLQMEQVPTILLSNLTENQIRRFRLLDNKIAELAEDSLENIKIELLELNDESLNELYFDMLEIEQELDEDFSHNLGEVVYEPKNTKHKVSDLYQRETKFDEDIAKIQNKELRAFFSERTHNFSSFDFSKIADYYAYQATPEEQVIFEKLALVLLDKNKLIANGFSKLIDNINLKPEEYDKL